MDTIRAREIHFRPSELQQVNSCPFPGVQQIHSVPCRFLKTFVEIYGYLMIYPSIGFHVKFSLNSDGSMLILRRCFPGKGCNKR